MPCQTWYGPNLWKLSSIFMGYRISTHVMGLLRFHLGILHLMRWNQQILILVEGAPDPCLIFKNPELAEQ